MWLFEKDSEHKLKKLTKTSPWVTDQLKFFYDEKVTAGLLSKVMAFRLMHLHGRALPILVPRAVERLQNYHWLDGEVVAGMVIGWNFGEGHLHQEQLLEAVQAQCGFAPGELRCVFVESAAAVSVDPRVSGGRRSHRRHRARRVADRRAAVAPGVGLDSGLAGHVEPHRIEAGAGGDVERLAIGPAEAHVGHVLRHQHPGRGKPPSGR